MKECVNEIAWGIKAKVGDEELKDVVGGVSMPGVNKSELAVENTFFKNDLHT